MKKHKKRNFQARKCLRQQLWQSMRILRRFSVAELCPTTEPECTIANAQSYVSRLFNAGFLRKDGQVKRGFAGQVQKYVLVKDIGPTMPVLNLGRYQKNKEKETNKDKENTPVPEDVNHDAA